jgi:hypothetical protein
MWSCTCASTEHQAMKAYWGSGGIIPRIPYLGTRWRWVVSFMLRLLYPRGKSPLYPLDRRLGGPRRRSGRGCEEKNSQPLTWLENPTIQPIAQRYTTELSRLLWYLIKHREDYALGEAGWITEQCIAKWGENPTWSSHEEANLRHGSRLSYATCMYTY